MFSVIDLDASTYKPGKDLEADSLSVVNSAATFKATLSQPTTLTGDQTIAVQDAAMTITTTAQASKLDGIEASATADQSDAEIETAYNNQVAVVSQGDAEAGTSTTPESFAQGLRSRSYGRGPRVPRV